MGFLLEELENGAKLASVAFQQIGRAETDQLRQRIVDQFADGKDEWPIWEDMDATAIQDDDAWRWIAEFDEGPVFLVFNKHRERHAVRFDNSADLIRALDESARFEFYICDPAVTYLFCFNDHRYLVAAGRAKPWLQSRIDRAAQKGT